ncbi:hypothetical protein FOY91_04615 [Sphingomonas solaris]|uniref:HD domain-containing protein n=2 Tax=Alterirhizorhabdus solaris TaxID=2529389 RepID=A0A558RAE9_9SPHN|nr:hypothetical protein FOY91_04615 [Sphingomonas solaris]
MADAGVADLPVSPEWLPLLTELGDLKRTYSANAAGSIAERLFARGWGALAAGQDAGAVMRAIVSTALAAARLGDLDRERLMLLGLSADAAATVLARALDEVAGPLDPALCEMLRAAVGEGAPDPAPLPGFVAKLARQPRAGVTCPGRPRLMLQPAENHAEHSVAVAIYAALLAPGFAADPVAAFLAGIAHHLYSADMPDSGFSGEMLLGDELDGVIARSREMALADLSPPVAAMARAAVALIVDDATPEARAFHAADVLDRVLETAQHLRAREATMDVVLHEYELVHAGPVKPFHDAVLRRVGLL